MRNEEHSKIHCIIDTVAQSFHRGCKSNSTVSRLAVHVTVADPGWGNAPPPNCINTTIRLLSVKESNINSWVLHKSLGNCYVACVVVGSK